jgi:hypothetical protein
MSHGPPPPPPSGSFYGFSPFTLNDMSDVQNSQVCNCLFGLYLDPLFLDTLS